MQGGNLSDGVLFAYGTLQVPGVMSALIGRVPRCCPARLAGYARYKVRSRSYPGIVRHLNSSVDGLVYFDLTYDELAILDAFEDDLYVREVVYVDIREGCSTSARAYTVVGENARLLDVTAPWSLDEFIRDHRAGYIHHCETFRSYFA